jgi:hypothetical protein
MLTIFFKRKEFVLVNLLPHPTSSAIVFFVDNMTVPLDSWHVQQRGDITHCKRYLHFNNPKCHTAQHIRGQMTSHRRARVSHRPDLPDLAIADFCLFGP